MNILFICQGNVARSQMAEAFFNKFNKKDKAYSAGTLDFTPTKYVHPVVDVITVMKEEGIDVSKQKVKLVTYEMVKSADAIYVMCSRNDLPDFVMNEKQKTTFWKIEDPFETSLENYRKIRDQIKALVKSISVKANKT